MRSQSVRELTTMVNRQFRISLLLLIVKRQRDWTPRSPRERL